MGGFPECFGENISQVIESALYLSFHKHSSYSASFGSKSYSLNQIWLELGKTENHNLWHEQYLPHIYHNSDFPG